MKILIILSFCFSAMSSWAQSAPRQYPDQGIDNGLVSDQNIEANYHDCEPCKPNLAQSDIDRAPHKLQRQVWADIGGKTVVTPGSNATDTAE